MCTVPVPPGEFPLDHILKVYGGGEVNWIIGQEEVSENDYHHLQFVVMFNQTRSLNQAKIALFSENVVPVKDLKQAVAYCTKLASRKEGTDVFTQGPVPDNVLEAPADSQNARKRKLLEEAQTLESKDLALKKIREEDPLWYISQGKQLGAYLSEVMQEASNKSNYTSDQFNVPPLEVDRKRAIVIVGPTGIGKTQWALAHFNNPVHVRDKNDYCRMGDTTDGLVIDDMPFHQWDPLSLLRLVDVEVDITQDVKYSHRVIRKGMPRFIISNGWRLFWNPRTPQVTAEAIARRCVAYVVKTSLFGDTPAQLMPIDTKDMVRFLEMIKHEIEMKKLERVRDRSLAWHNK